MRVGIIGDNWPLSDDLREEVGAALAVLDDRADVVVLNRHAAGVSTHACLLCLERGIPYELVSAVMPGNVDELWYFTRRRHFHARSGRDVPEVLAPRKKLTS